MHSQKKKRYFSHIYQHTSSASRGTLYSWWLIDTNTDEKVARTRVALIAHTRRLLNRDEAWQAYVQDERGL